MSFHSSTAEILMTTPFFHHSFIAGNEIKSIDNYSRRNVLMQYALTTMAEVPGSLLYKL